MTESETRKTAAPPEPDDELRELVADLDPMKSISYTGTTWHRARTYLTGLLESQSAGTLDLCLHWARDHKLIQRLSLYHLHDLSKRFNATVASQRIEIEKLVEKVRGLERRVEAALTFIADSCEENHLTENDVGACEACCFVLLAAREPSEPAAPSAEPEESA